MTLGQFISDTRKRWLRAFKLIKRFKRKQLQAPKNNQVTPVTPTIVTTSCCGTADGSADIGVQSCDCTHSTENRLNENRPGSCSIDSAYETGQNSPASSRNLGRHSAIAYATVTYFNVKEREETSSINTVMTWIDGDGDGTDLQNAVNEKIELMTSL